MQVKKQQLELDMEQQTGSKWEKEYVKAVRLLLFSPGSWCTQGFVCALQESVSPVLWKSYNQYLWPPESKLGVFSPFARSQVGKSVVGPRTSLRV